MPLKNLFKSLPLVNHSLAYNPSIDGLRGVAVLLVVIFHIWHEIFSFGYVGVDIFFVLSGFLITQIIYQKISRNAFSLKEFYRNRIRRIFPAVIITLLAVFSAGYLFMFNDELLNLGKHIKSSALFYENFRLIGEVGYWDKDASLKPLLHFWSLAIEEQFYIFWPFILIILFYAKNNFNIKISISLSLICALLFILPFFLEINKFYHLLSRSYELAFGSLAFVLAKEYKKLRAYLHIYKKFIYAFFVIAILASINNTEYNAFKTLLITLASCALIISLNREKQSRVFANSPLVFLGLISFPLYLNHYAIISFCHILGIDISAWRGVLVLIICVFLAFLVYRFIELYARAQKSYVFALILLVAMIFTGLLGIAIQKDKLGLNSKRDFAQVLNFELFALADPLKHDDIHTKTLFEKFNINRNSATNEQRMSLIKANTADLNENLNLIMGDSHAYFLGIEILKNDKKFKSIISAASTCPFSFDENTDYRKCRAFIRDFESKLLSSPNIKRLFITALANDATILGQTKNYKIYEQYLDDLFKILSNKNYAVYFIIDTPNLTFEPISCVQRYLNNIKIKPTCFLARDLYDEQTKIYKKMVKKISAKYPKITIIDPTPVFCDDKKCVIFENGKPLYGDTNHLTPLGEKKLFNEIKKYIKDFE